MKQLVLAQMAGADGPSAFGPLLMMFAIFGIFYFIVMRPQQKREREKENFRSKLKKGDEVLAAGNGQACDPVAGELCDPEHVCVIQSADANGIIATCMPNVASGAGCTAAFPDQCPDDEYCQIEPSMLEGTCVPRPGVGEACGRGPFATEGSICAASTRCNGGRCREPATLGEVCSADQACLSERCRDGACVSTDSCD